VSRKINLRVLHLPGVEVTPVEEETPEAEEIQEAEVGSIGDEEILEVEVGSIEVEVVAETEEDHWIEVEVGHL
jgi:hypothetical protein